MTDKEALISQVEGLKKWPSSASSRYHNAAIDAALVLLKGGDTSALPKPSDATTNQRDSFEKWAESQTDFTLRTYMDDDGEYLDMDTRIAHASYVSAQAALIAELVERLVGEYEDAYPEAWNDAIDKAIEIVKGAGV